MNEMTSAENAACDGCQKRPCVCETVVLLPSAEKNAAFYQEYYSDWTVHELRLVVSVPMKDADRGEALALVREILDAAGFDIRAYVLPPANPAPTSEGGA